MTDDRLGTLMVAFFSPSPQPTNFIGEVVGIADHPIIYFKPDEDDCQRDWAAHLCRPTTKDDHFEYWRSRALGDVWDRVTDRRSGGDRRKTYGRRDVDSR